MRRPLTRAGKRLADQIATASAPAAKLDPVAVVTNVAAGAAADGNALVTVDWMGDSYQASYLNTYTPVVGHVVRIEWLASNGTGQLLILGRIIGTP